MVKESGFHEDLPLLRSETLQRFGWIFKIFAPTLRTSGTVRSFHTRWNLDRAGIGSRLGWRRTSGLSFFVSLDTRSWGIVGFLPAPKVVDPQMVDLPACFAKTKPGVFDFEPLAEMVLLI